MESDQKGRQLSKVSPFYCAVVAIEAEKGIKSLSYMCDGRMLFKGNPDRLGGAVQAKNRRKKTSSGPGMRIFSLEDVSIVLIAEEITQIGLFFAEIDVLLSALIEMLIAYGFTFYWLTFSDRNFLVLKFRFQTKIRICNDSDSFITLTIM